MASAFFVPVFRATSNVISEISELTMKELIYWGSYLYFPLVLLCFLIALKGSQIWKVFAFSALVPASVLAYARFVEPQRLNVVATEFDLTKGEQGQLVRAALFADMHYGIFGNSVSLKRIVRAINRVEVDVVFIPGDFVYHLPVDQFAETFAPLAELDAPVFAVLGNHDVGFPGPDVGKPLADVLRQFGVTLVENTVVSMEISGRTVNIAGASDLWQSQMSFDYISELGDEPLIFLAHNPDTAYALPAEITYDIMLTGHTHGGQIRVPGMLRSVIPTEYPFDYGMHQVELDGTQRNIFVTPGNRHGGVAYAVSHATANRYPQFANT